MLNYTETINIKNVIDAVIKQHFFGIESVKISYNKDIINPEICNELYYGTYKTFEPVKNLKYTVTACLITEINGTKKYCINTDLIASCVIE